jgi:formylglycine-generating enzyme required for sulfatase activity
LELEFRRGLGETLLRAVYDQEWPDYRSRIAEVFNSVLPGNKAPVSSTRSCPSCGADMPAKAMYCGKCGNRMDVTPRGESPIPAGPTPSPVPVLPPTPVAVSVDEPVAEERREARADAASPSGSLRPMVLIAAGEFIMGSPDGAGQDDERPQHTVKLRAYYIDRHAVSNAEYERFDPTHKRHRPSEADGDDDPVVMVTYEDCLNYCRWRAAQEKVAPDSYSLPTEAQWERAARGGFPDRLYAWGDAVHLDLCNTLETGRRRAIGVGLGIPNGFLLFHMGSNVREWCFDFYAPSYYGQKVPQWIDPQGPAPNPMEKFRVVRGASFIEPAETLGRCAARGFAAPRSRQSDIGFRCVRAVGK